MRFTLLLAVCLSSFAVEAAPTAIIKMPKDVVNYTKLNYNMTNMNLNKTNMNLNKTNKTNINLNKTKKVIVMYPCLEMYDPTNPCSDCINFVDELRVILEKNNSTIIPLIQWISMICHNIYGPSAKECYNITHAIDNIMGDVLHNSSKVVCHQMAQC